MSRHFWVLVVGTLAFIGLFLSLLTGSLGYSETVEGHTWLIALAIKDALLVLGCYLAFVAVVFGHRLLRPEPPTPQALRGDGPPPSVTVEPPTSADRARN